MTLSMTKRPFKHNINHTSIYQLIYYDDHLAFNAMSNDKENKTLKYVFMQTNTNNYVQ